ncbi:hypothetical protein A0H81_12505 [Grifola frondosa]|uniref:Uncharacterized protein n=1 Tax=Grifola frondosa TaxID=5627 RepID=A0A1C7LRZ8_GRIFR|nr:hypothetical protein A0H81_12505 [Grifola frondosa]
MQHACLVCSSTISPAFFMLMLFESSRLNLEYIDDDVLYLILEKIQTFGLRSTFMVSHRLRHACLPFMFRICTLGFIKGGDTFPPPAILYYIRVVKLLWASNYFPQFCANFELRGIAIRDSPRYYICNKVDSGDPQMVESIVNMFPELRFLEIHRYPSDDSEKSASKEIVTTLSRLKNLRVLRLNLHSTSHPSFEVVLESIDVLGERAQVVADAFPLSQLSQVAFLRRNYHHENYWATWSCRLLSSNPRAQYDSLSTIVSVSCLLEGDKKKQGRGWDMDEVDINL